MRLFSLFEEVTMLARQRNLALIAARPSSLSSLRCGNEPHCFESENFTSLRNPTGFDIQKLTRLFLKVAKRNKKLYKKDSLREIKTVDTICNMQKMRTTRCSNTTRYSIAKNAYHNI